MKLHAACLVSCLALALGAVAYSKDFPQDVSVEGPLQHRTFSTAFKAGSETSKPPPRNPALSDTPWWAQQHGNSYCTDSVKTANGPCWVPPDDPTLVRVQYCCMNAPAIFAYVYNYKKFDKQVLWLISGVRVAKVDMDTFEALSCKNRLSPHKFCNHTDMCKTVDDTNKQLCFFSDDDGMDHPELGNQIAASGAYSILSFDNNLYAPGGDFNICRYSDKGIPSAPIEVECKDLRFVYGGCDLIKHGPITALTMLYTGEIAAVTGGNGSCSSYTPKCFAAIFVVDRNLTSVKFITPLNRDSGGVSTVVKGLSNDAEGRIFAPTTEQMYAISASTGAILWNSTYPNSENGDEYCNIKFGRGAGSTPSAMDCGDDKLVITTGGDFPFSLVAFNRSKAEHETEQIVGTTPVNMDWGTLPNTDFQSISIVDCDVVVVNNALKMNARNHKGECLSPTSLVALSGNPRYVTRGAAGYRWNTTFPGNHYWTQSWTNDVIQSPNAIPGQCSDEEGNVFSYYMTAYNGNWSAEVLDSDGNRAGIFTLGRLPQWNSFYAAAMPMDGALYYGVALGTIKLSTSRHPDHGEEHSSGITQNFGPKTRF